MNLNCLYTYKKSSNRRPSIVIRREKSQQIEKGLGEVKKVSEWASKNPTKVAHPFAFFI